MPLPIPILDDRTFEQLVQEAIRRIPVYAPEWTDHNASDPGITLIELFAWLTEMQLYSLDRILALQEEGEGVGVAVREGGLDRVEHVHRGGPALRRHEVVE